jgi:carboxyl-terminal processing protease
MFRLNYDKYRASLDVSESEAKRFEELSNYETNLTFESLSQELKLMEQDSVLKEKRERWHKSLSKDAYIEEALNVLNDLKMTYGIKSKVATSVKN